MERPGSPRLPAQPPCSDSASLRLKSGGEARSRESPAGLLEGGKAGVRWPLKWPRCPRGSGAPCRHVASGGERTLHPDDTWKETQTTLGPHSVRAGDSALWGQFAYLAAVVVTETRGRYENPRVPHACVLCTPARLAATKGEGDPRGCGGARMSRGGPAERGV